MLWACLHFPRLPLEVFTRGGASLRPLAVIGGGTRPAVIASDRAAETLGVRPGLPLASALALAPGLDARARDPQAEARALAGLAAWAYQFTPTVSLAAPDAVLLEIGGSLRLFGGLDALLGALREGAAALGYEAAVAAAPAPEGARLLARAGLDIAATDPQAARRAVRSLAVELLDCPAETLEVLAGLGVRTVGDCLRLPRDGFARRFGQRLLDLIGRALGELPDPRPPFAPPEAIECRLELPAPVWETEALLFAARRLLREVCGLLAARNAGATRLELSLLHGDGPPTPVAVGLGAPGRDPERILPLLRERLARIGLRDRVEGLALSAPETAQLAPRSFSLFPPAGEADEARTALVERLRARLGDAAVSGLQLVPDHRPELAWREATPGTPATRLPAHPRPLWLLFEPRPLAARNERPWLEGPLDLAAGPERIESGWWDGRDVARDYFVALDPRGARYWVFRERGGEGWFLHGVFA